MFSRSFLARVVSLMKRLLLSSTALRSRAASLASCLCRSKDLSWNGSDISALPPTPAREPSLETGLPESEPLLSPSREEIDSLLLAPAVGEGVISFRLRRLLELELDEEDIFVPSY